MILADYGTEFHAVSLRHEALIKKAEDILDDYQRGDALIRRWLSRRR